MMSRILALAFAPVLALAPVALYSQAQPAISQMPLAGASAQIYNNLEGHWAGVLEYRDYQSNSMNDPHVKLPTWLDIDWSPGGGSLTLRYTYDDGPSKTVHETERLTISATPPTWKLKSEGEPEETYAIRGLDQLKEGRGKLTLTGTGTENGVKVDVQTSVQIGRNVFILERMTRPANAEGQPFAFRHVFTFTRTTPPTAALKPISMPATN
jgi:hypothetical protein